MTKKRIYQEATKGKQALAGIFDLCLSLFLFVFTLIEILSAKNLSTRFDLLLQNNLIIPWSIILFSLLVGILPHTLSLFVFSKSFGQLTLGLKTYSMTHSRGKINLLSSALKALLSLVEGLLFSFVPHLLAVLSLKIHLPSDRLCHLRVIEKVKEKRKTSSFSRVASIFFLLWILPTHLIFIKKVYTNTKPKIAGWELFEKNKPSLIASKKQRNLKKRIRTPNNFKEFFQELRWSLIWKDYERHMHLLTEKSRLLVSLNLDLYKRSLPADIRFSHLEKTDRKNLFKLYYAALDKEKKNEHLEFFYLTKKNKLWQLDHTKLFLKYYLGPTGS